MKPAGGIERVVSTLANELCYNYQVCILVKDKGESFYPLNPKIEVISINSEVELNMNSRISRAFSLLKNFFSSTLKLRNYLASSSFDYIYVTTPLAFWESFFSGFCNSKIIASEHGARTNYNSVYNFLKKGYKFSAFYMVPTVDDYNYYLDKGYPVKYIPHLRPDLAYSKNQVSVKKILNIGRYTNDKQQLKLIHMWNELVKQRDAKDWVLVIVGSGELENKMKMLISELKLDDLIELVPPQKNIEKIYLDASLFVLSSSSEGFGMVVLEALSFGLPVVSFDCPSGPKDIITNNKDGVLIEPDNFDELKNNLLSLMINKKNRQEMSDYGYERMKHWNSENIMSKFEGML